jgi:hypothetical protein
MAVTQSTNRAVIKATAQSDVIPGKFFKAIFWVLSGATINTHKLEITENDSGAHVIYADAAPKTDGAVAIPCPAEPVEGLKITDLDNGYILAYPI